MATTKTTKSTTTKSTTRKPTTKTASKAAATKTASKATATKTASKAAATKTASKAAATKTPATKTAPKAPSTSADPVVAATGPKAPVLFDRSPAVLAQQVALAYAGVLGDLATFVQAAPRHLPESPAQARDQVKAGLDNIVTTFNRRFDASVVDGREVTSKLLSDPRVERVTNTLQPVVKQADNTRMQLRKAFTSVSKTAVVAGDAAGEQADTARSQVKGAVTSISRIADAALGAGRKQADTARSQVKAAVTSSRKTVDTAVDAGRKLAS